MKLLILSLLLLLSSSVLARTQNTEQDKLSDSIIKILICDSSDYIKKFNALKIYSKIYLYDTSMNELSLLLFPMLRSDKDPRIRGYAKSIISTYKKHDSISPFAILLTLPDIKTIDSNTSGIRYSVVCKALESCPFSNIDISHYYIALAKYGHYTNNFLRRYLRKKYKCVYE